MGAAYGYGSSPTAIAAVVSVSTTFLRAAGNLSRFFDTPCLLSPGRVARLRGVMKGGLDGWWRSRRRPALGF